MPIRLGVRQIAAAVALIAFAIFGIKSCTSADNVSCSDFLKQSSSQQLKAVREWQKTNGGRPLGSMSDAADLTAISAYCAEAGHGDDKVSRLGYRVG